MMGEQKKMQGETLKKCEKVWRRVAKSRVKAEKDVKMKVWKETRPSREEMERERHKGKRIC